MSVAESGRATRYLANRRILKEMANRQSPCLEAWRSADSVRNDRGASEQPLGLSWHAQQPDKRPRFS